MGDIHGNIFLQGSADINDSRLETIADVPAGKVLFHFENVDMKEAKKIVGKDHCISGGFSSRILKEGTPEKVSEEVKRLLDVAAVDGGYIFDLSDTLDDVPAANVEAIFKHALRKECLSRSNIFYIFRKTV